MIQTTGPDAKKATWVMLCEHIDSLAKLRKRLPRNLFLEYAAEGPRAGTRSLLGRPEYAGESASVQVGPRELAKAEFKLSGLLAVASVPLPADTLREPAGKLRVVLGDSAVGETDMLLIAKTGLRAFLDESLRFERYVITLGPFPAVRWEHPDEGRANMGQFELKTAFYDANMNEVNRAEEPGRYGAGVSARTPDGYEMRRYATLYCVGEDWNWDEEFGVAAQPFAKFGIPSEARKRNQDRANRAVGEMVLRNAAQDSDFAVALTVRDERCLCPGIERRNVRC